MEEKFENTFEYKLIYVFGIDDESHKGCLKVGEATIHTNKKYTELPPESRDLNDAANKRISSYTTTAGIRIMNGKPLYTEIAVYSKDGLNYAFSDHDVHNVLKRSGIKNKYFDTINKANEWFITDLQTVKNAIKAVKNNQTALAGCQISNDKNPIVFRPEQSKAIEETIKQFKTNNHMLWNAKMRFGKTITALQLIKELQFKRTIIITHRPDVDKGWFEDFAKVFYELDTEYSYGSKNNGRSIEDLLKSGKPFVYFASIQDLRGSVEVGGKYPKNDEIFAVDWDFVVTDEAHEGTQTELGKKVRDKLITKDNKELSLSGTPFNLFDLYSNETTYTWDYIMEQEAKNKWYKNNYCDTNPYENLPKLNIFTYHLEKNLPEFFDSENKAFNFREFFRTWTGNKTKDNAIIPEGSSIGDFVHEKAVVAFLDLLCEKNQETNYPFSTEEYRALFRHTLWMIPGVAEGKALEKLLKKHSVFGSGAFKIVNVAGNGSDEYKEEKRALDKLRKAIGPDPANSYTITLSCGRLTTGVTVPEWTGVLMLSGSYVSDAKQYLQTIFRVQSPANIDGKIKTNCYVFDFAPDRTLRVVYDAVKKMSQKRDPKTEVSYLMSEFLNFCPVISFDASKMIEIKAEELLQEIKRVYIEHVVDSGFEDQKLYNDTLLKLDGIELEKFNELSRIIGKTNQTKKVKTVDVSKNNLTEEERKLLEETKKNKRDNESEEEKQAREAKRKALENKATAVSILRGISIRIPLLVYGMDENIDTDITIDNFTDLMKDEGPNPDASWNEFMPKGVTKEMFNEFSKYYDKDIFIAACKKIRMVSKQADELEPKERIKELTKLFNKFKNPDKETVLTPWRVVNMHMAQTLGGYCFYDENYKNEIEEPRYVDNGGATKDTLSNKEANILEINSKTGLYPLYVTYSLFRTKLGVRVGTLEEQLKVWDDVVANNMYVICKTPMAKSITKRTLLGYRKGKINAHAFDDLINQMKEKQDQLVKKIKNPGFWNKGGSEMKFNAVVGNPPYQIEIDNSHRQVPVYHFFFNTAFCVSNLVTLITPARFLFNAGLTPSDWNGKMLSDDHLKVIKFYKDSHEVFPSVDIKGGVVITIHNENQIYGAINHFTENKTIDSILNKVLKKTNTYMNSIIFSKSTYNFTSTLYVDFPQYKNVFTKGNEFIVDASSFKLMPLVFHDECLNDDLLIYGRQDNHRVIKYLNKKYIKSNDNLNSYKVVLPGANGNGKMGEKLGFPFIGEPFQLYTQTYMSIGCFKKKINAEFALKYLKTKFLRILLGTLKVTHNTAKDTWKNVPLFAFDDTDTIDWNRNVEDIDKQLCDYFELSQEEKKFINETAEYME